MKLMKKNLILAALLVVLLVTLTGCGGNPLVGTWKLVDAEGTGIGGFETEAIEMVTAFGGSIEMIFTDKEMTLSAEMFGAAENQTTSYTVKGNMITIDAGIINYKIEKDTLTLYEGESSLVLTRVKK